MILDVLSFQTIVTYSLLLKKNYKKVEFVSQRNPKVFTSVKRLTLIIIYPTGYTTKAKTLMIE